jgi:hypothetical protein
MGLILFWIGMPTIGYLVAKWVDYNNKMERIKNAQNKTKENRITYIK